MTAFLRESERERENKRERERGQERAIKFTHIT